MRPSARDGDQKVKKEEDVAKMLRVILRNQRFMMIAMSNLVRDNTKICNVYHAEKLSTAVRQMEEHWEWIAAPSERLG